VTLDFILEAPAKTAAGLGRAAHTAILPNRPPKIEFLKKQAKFKNQV
jgi:hypothetical protein